MSDDILRRLAPQVRNWGKWGPDDEVGTLNDITPDAIAAAARLAADCAADGRGAFCSSPRRCP